MVLAAALTACGGGSSPSASKTPANPATRLTTPAAPLTDVTIPCANFQAAASKIAAAEAKLYSANSGVATLDALAAELGKLKDGAPSDVKAAIDDLVSAFRSAEAVLKNPTAQGQAQLASLGQKLSADGQKITAYVTSKCKG